MNLTAEDETLKSQQPSFTTDADPPFPADGWYYAVDGLNVGPVSRDQMVSAARSAPVTAKVLVWHPSRTDWVDVRQSGLLAGERGPPALPDAPSGKRGFRAALFSFEERMARRPFLLWSCLAVFVYILIVVSVLLAAHLDLNAPDAVAIRVCVALPFAWSMLALTTKRLHDLDRSAKHLLWVVPVIYATNLPATMPARAVLLVMSSAVELWLVCKRGTAGPNSFGPDPLGRAAASVQSVPITASERPRRKWPWAVGALVVVGVAGLWVLGNIDADLPSCSEAHVTDQVKQIVANSPASALAALVSGGPDNLSVSVTDVRTLSNDEPLNGRTCVATIAVSTKGGALGSGEAATREATFTIQKVDNQGGRYVIKVEQ